MAISLNDAQTRAVETPAPLLIIAGAGSGKTHTLSHRVARLCRDGADPRRILLLTFSRRAADDMCRRTKRLVKHADQLSWAGTFHAIANRVLRLHAASVGLDPSFTVLDRGDSADLIDVVRHARGLSKKSRRFPQKGTCLAIYSRVVNAQEPLQLALKRSFPWCEEWEPELRALFVDYVEQKQRTHVLDYDDLLLYWKHLMGEPALAAHVRRLFDHVLVDEYQDTNALQAEILFGLCPAGANLTVVGDDAQSIYAFRAATVRNILDFPQRCTPHAAIVTLEESFRSTPPILDAANGVIALARERFTKNLFSRRVGIERPALVTTDDEMGQVEYVVKAILAAREEGVALKQQAVLFRSAHHSDALEVELSRRNIPFVKFGGLKFLEAAHVKDTLGCLRWGENPRDPMAAYRVLQLLPGVGPSVAERALAAIGEANHDLGALRRFRPPAASAADWPALCDVMARLRDPATAWQGQLGMVRQFYQPHLERLYDNAMVRARDLDQLEQLAGEWPSRERFLSELTLDPPQATSAEAGPPLLDEDYLILSTIHSAKGQEWDAVYLLNAVDGCMPSDLSTGTPEEIEEERRLLYVAMTRARDRLHVITPQRFYVHGQRALGDRHVYADRTRFIPETLLDRFERVVHARVPVQDGGADPNDTNRPLPTVDVAARLKAQWT